MISRETIDEILARTNLEELISSYVALRRAGSNYLGLCPFHSEKTPSFTVFKGGEDHFYCFGCGTGGNAITFIKKIENLDFEEAVIFLGKRVGITVDTGRDRGGPRVDKKRIYDMNREAAKYFHAKLYENTPEAHAALDYLKGKRRLSDAVIKHFGLGFQPSKYGALRAYLNSKGYTDDELVMGFLCGRDAQTGRLYDTFRNRVMFPIIDVSGNVIAFGGRVTDDSLPKYKNSSDTPVFLKHRNLFALNFARTSCAERIILCEGYMDVIALHAAGFSNAVATLGTAITQDQARLMSRYTKSVIISYDSDAAGQKAADKALRLLEEAGLEAKVLKMTGAKDPDEYIKEFGRDKFVKLLDGSKTKFDFNLEKITAKYDLDDPQQKIQAIGELSEMISEFYSSAERQIYANEIAKKFGIDKKSIESDVERIIKKKQREGSKNESRRIKAETSGYGDKINRDFAKAPAAARYEESVLGLLLNYEEYRKAAFDGEGETYLDDDDFFTEFGKRVFLYVKNSLHDGSTSAFIDDAFTPEEVGRITKMQLDISRLTNKGDAVFAECVAKMKNAVRTAKGEGEVTTLDDLQNLILRKRSDD